jgi:hypothetical protein
MVETLHIRTYVVWIPMLDADEGSEVPSASTNVATSPQYFDGTKLVGDSLAKTLGTSTTVWDVYLFYPPGATWPDQGLAMPELWIAQMVGVVLGAPSASPALPDQSQLPPELRGKAVVIGSQDHFEQLLDRAAQKFVRTPR